ncbi:MAG: endolytic transglycosylase MltG [Deltaproteobacteria bacterium]|nr:endolytic transglycosylase MltG [Deltaproteobacteria bacterium]
MSHARVMHASHAGSVSTVRCPISSASSGLRLLLLLFLLLACAFFYSAISIPYGAEGKVAGVEVRVGEPFPRVAHKLSDDGVISNKIVFTLWARLWGLDRKLKSGLYRFELPVSAREVLNRLVLGKGAFDRVTIPEGLTVKQVAELLERNGLVEKERFLAQASNPEDLSWFGLRGTGVEGYLFPETYYFPRGASEMDILQIMVNQFDRVFTDAMEVRGRELGLTRDEVVILASLVEKETGRDSERPLVSAVFHNRLKRRMPLQSDPTVIYGLENFSGNLTREHLRTKTPYNTYLTQGLPPSPICNPGLASLQAALYPVSAPYLYFVSKNDGSHFFSVSFEKHSQAVKIYQRKFSRLSRPSRSPSV